jgi:rod shape-determining protein MreC
VQIDRGEQDGLDSDMPVVTDIGLVGKTTTVASNTAYVLLIIDENCKVAANVEGTREQGILSGERTSSGVQPDLVLSFLSKSAELHAGQKVFSSGVSGGVFPSGLLLGSIRQFQVRALDGRAQVVPAVDFSKLENVFVVLGTRPPPKK